MDCDLADSHHASDDDIEPQPKVIIKPRLISKNTPQTPTGDFFSRKPHVGLEAWNDALQMWEELFHSETIDHLPPKILRQVLKQSLGDIDKFRNDNRFDQEILLKWEQEFIRRLDAFESVSS
jgi:hypothetical protein